MTTQSIIVQGETVVTEVIQSGPQGPSGAASGGGASLEQVQDDLGTTSLVAGTSLTKTYDDGAGTITLDVDADDFATAAQGALADTATQPGDLGTAAAADTGDFEPAGTVATHSADTTSVHGIADTSALLDTDDIGVSVQAYDAALDAVTGTNTGDEEAASTTTAGIVELATTGEVDTGTDTARAITPAALAGSALQSKVDGIEANADVTDTANVTAAGAVMDSEVTNLAAVKAFDPTDYATAAQGSTADSAMQDLVDDTTPQLGGTLDTNGQSIQDSDDGVVVVNDALDVQGNITVTGTVDGVDVAAIASTYAVKAQATVTVDAGSTAGTARPTGWGHVQWIVDNGVTPTNAASDDLIFEREA